MNNKIVFFIVTFFCISTVLSADIIKLKRGVSFEGTVLEETYDQYSVEMDIGTVTFNKEDVDSIEKQEVDDAFTLPYEYYGKTDGDEVVAPIDAAYDEGSSELLETDELLLDEDDPYEGIIKYQGRYVSPEVFGIMKRQQDVQGRRSDFVAKKAQAGLQKKYADALSESQAEAQEESLDKAGDEKTQDLIKYELKSNQPFGGAVTHSLGTRRKDRVQEQTYRKYGMPDMDRTI